MKIIINYNYALLKKITGIDSEELLIENNFLELADLIAFLSEKYGKKFKDLLLDKGSGKIRLLMLINGIAISNINYRLSNADVLNILPLTTGG